MWVIIAIASSVIFGLGSVVMKSATLKQCLDQYILFGLYFAGALFFLTMSDGKFHLTYSFEFILFSILIAFGSFFGNWAVIKALELGPASLTAPMLNLNLPLIIFMSVFFYGEKLDIIKILIILFLLIGVIIVKIDPHEHLVIKDKRWLIYVLLGALCLFFREGGLKITQEAGINNTEILFVSYVICLTITCITIFVLPYLKPENRPKEFCTTKHKLKSINFGLIAGVCSGAGLYLYSSALSLGPASIVVIIFSARSFVILAFAYFLHKERLSFFQICSLIFLSCGLALSGFVK